MMTADQHDDGWNSADELHTIRVPALRSSEQEKTITVRLANSHGHRNAATMLINRMYSWRGYGADHRLSATSSRTTFTAYDEDQVIGTLTLGVDSPDGLAADIIFRDEIDVFRSEPGTKVCELTKLAFDSNVPSKPLLAAFFHIIFIYGQRRHQCTHLFIEVNPRHRRFYQIMLGFQPIGELRMNQDVGAPAQLMMLKIADLRALVDHHAGRSSSTNTRSLYPFFFSPCEEQGIYARLGGGVSPREMTYLDPGCWCTRCTPNMPASAIAQQGWA